MKKSGWIPSDIEDTRVEEEFKIKITKVPMGRRTLRYIRVRDQRIRRIEPIDKPIDKPT